MITPWGDDAVDESSYNDDICPHGFSEDEQCCWCDGWNDEEQPTR
jgi:hypothetical protein